MSLKSQNKIITFFSLSVMLLALRCLAQELPLNVDVDVDVGASAINIKEGVNESIFYFDKKTNLLISKGGYYLQPVYGSEIKIGTYFFFLGYFSRPIENNPKSKYRCAKAEEVGYLFKAANGTVAPISPPFDWGCSYNFFFDKDTSIYTIPSAGDAKIQIAIPSGKMRNISKN